MLRIYFRTNCPICKKQLKSVYGGRKCKNGCYGFNHLKYDNTTWVPEGWNCVTVFDACFGVPIKQKDKISKRECEKMIKTAINYWKKNDKYLMQIMSGEQNE